MKRLTAIATALLCATLIQGPALGKNYAIRSDNKAHYDGSAERGWVFRCNTVQIYHAWWDTFGSSNVTLWVSDLNDAGNSPYYAEVGHHSGDAFSGVYGLTQSDEERFYMGFSDTGAGDITVTPYAPAIGSDHTYYIYKNSGQNELNFQYDSTVSYIWADADAQNMAIKWSDYGLEANNDQVTFTNNNSIIYWNGYVAWDGSLHLPEVPSYSLYNNAPFTSVPYDGGYGNYYGLRMYKQ